MLSNRNLGTGNDVTLSSLQLEVVTTTLVIFRDRVLSAGWWGASRGCIMRNCSGCMEGWWNLLIRVTGKELMERVGFGKGGLRKG